MFLSHPQPRAAGDTPPDHRLPNCRRCGYDLRGSQTRGHCPECGQAYDYQTGVGLAYPPTRGAPALTWIDRLGRYAGVLFWALIALTILALFLLIEGPTLRTAIVALSLLLAATLIVIGKMTWTVMHGEPVTQAELGPNLLQPPESRPGQSDPFDPTVEHSQGIELEGDQPPDPPDTTGPDPDPQR